MNARALDWNIEQTGGGCTALVRPLPCKWEALVTDDSGGYAPDQDDDNLLVGVRNDKGNDVFCVDVENLPHAEAVVRAVEYLLSCEDDPRVLAWQLPAELESDFLDALNVGAIVIDDDDCYAINAAN